MDLESKLRELDMKFMLIIAFVGVLFYFFFIFKWPDQLGTVAKLEKELAQLDIDIKKANDAIDNVDNVQSELDQLKQEIKTLSKFFIFDENAKNIEQIISEEARSSGISLNQIKNQGDAFKSKPNTLLKNTSQSSMEIYNYIKRKSINASFSGTYFELMRFLSYLTRRDRTVSIKEITINSTGVKSKESRIMNLNFKIDFETYTILETALNNFIPEKK